ncbi:hypothetical protein CPLU01_02794 [Colletotrichum plurivorum]|uniref:Uncharacterized protein n=1 Tax=Colletotrichum plurivorum TaxID=2175906 RepID=A0A8H6KVH3_9PEZI|nr:hypothetical protein CPLU01_02794 [Colletotrichum plurivorum]
MIALSLSTSDAESVRNQAGDEAPHRTAPPQDSRSQQRPKAREGFLMDAAEEKVETNRERWVRFRRSEPQTESRQARMTQPGWTARCPKSGYGADVNA